MALTRFLVLLIAFGGPFWATAKPSALAAADSGCASALESKWYNRAFSLEIPRWSDDLSLVKASLEAQAWSSVRTFFSAEWDTQVYYTATGAPSADDFDIPLVDPDSKGVVLFIHGSGTVKSSGSNFIGNMSSLANLGYTGISIDLPFHSSGSLRERQMQIDYFMKYIGRIIKDLSSFGKPIYLAGHSFGPDVIFELVSRDPFAVKGALAMSPAGFNNVLSSWYKNYTARMKFGGDVMTNTAGSRWAGAIGDQLTWNRGIHPDPTVLNPHLNLVILYGDREEYFPAPVGGPNRTPVGPNTFNAEPVLRRFFKNAKIVVAKGIGHYLFDHKDENGQVIVTREMLTLLGENPREIKTLSDRTGAAREARGPATKVAHLYHFDYLFKSWFSSKYEERVIREVLRDNDTRRAQVLLNEYLMASEARFKEVMQVVANTKQSDPDFYAANAQRIEEALKKNRIDSSLIALYYRHKTGSTPTIN